MKKAILFMSFCIFILFACQNNTSQQQEKKETKVEIPTKPSRDYYAELKSLIKSSGLQVRNNDYYDIISVDTAYSKEFYNLWKDICESPYKNTSVCNDALAISVAIEFYKENLKSGKNKTTTNKPVKKEWEIKIGCTKEFVIDAWGKPDNYSSSENALGKIEMLYYYDKHKIITIVDGWVEQIDTYN